MKVSGSCTYTAMSRRFAFVMVKGDEDYRHNLLPYATRSALLLGFYGSGFRLSSMHCMYRVHRYAVSPSMKSSTFSCSLYLLPSPLQSILHGSKLFNIKGYSVLQDIFMGTNEKHTCICNSEVQKESLFLTNYLGAITLRYLP